MPEIRTAKGVVIEPGAKASKKTVDRMRREKEARNKGEKVPTHTEKVTPKKAVKEKSSREKNQFGFVKGSRKDFYCEKLLEGKWSKDEILKMAREKFGTASPNAFQFTRRDLQLKGHTIERRTVLILKNEHKVEEAK